jgi:NAD(P)H dehydrogenase (quinone)
VHVLIVYCHPSRASFCGTVLDRFGDGLTRAGHTYEVADLYAEDFDPVFSIDDYGQFEGKPMSEDVLAEQARVDRCEALAVVSPIWWLSLPAMLKGWFDRVWSNGWAYEWAHDPEGSLLAPRPFVFLLTAAGSAATWSRYGYGAALDASLRIGLLGWCGAGESTVAILHDTGFDARAMERHAACAGRLGETILDGGKGPSWPPSVTLLSGAPAVAVRDPEPDGQGRIERGIV